MISTITLGNLKTIEKQMERYITMFTVIETQIADLLVKDGYKVKRGNRINGAFEVVTIYRK